ncbi:MAG TPA: glycosyltransferase family 1 protein [Candidatus Saccharimonadales bacterium]|nr:glycosyltransferase family 1 protein [Candidatus Saccharimonadales bacterium]
MIIGIDGNEANVVNKVGISEYGFELLDQFNEYQIPNIKYQIYLKRQPGSDFPKESEKWHYRIVKPAKLWTQFGLPFDLYTHSPRPSVFFSPTHYAPRFCPVPTVISIMDLSYIHYPQLFTAKDLYQLQNWTAYSVKNATKILTISEASKRDIIKFYSVSQDKVAVTYLGIKAISMTKTVDIDSLQEKYGISKDYILFVGTLQPRKNIVRLVEAYSKLLKDPKKIPQLLIVGKKGWLYEEILAAPKLYGVEEHVKFLEFVNDDQLHALYKHALFFILPSLYEGFGLPVLEAMSLGCPVITSNVSSLPEAGGDAAFYIDPMNIDEITHAMEKLLADKKLRDAMTEKGYQQVKKFSWEKTAKKTLEILQEVGGNHAG